VRRRLFSLASALSLLLFAAATPTPTTPGIFAMRDSFRSLMAVARAISAGSTGELADRATYFRNDLAYAAFPGSLKNPHLFLVRIDLPAVAPFAIAAQQQIAMFFTSDGEVVIDPDGAGPFFEVPIDGPLPEELSFIP